jgi:hypothetical protein
MTTYYGSTVTGEVRGYSWNPRTGYQQVVLYTGTQSELDSIASVAKANNYSHRYVPDASGGYSTLEVTYGAAETQDPTEALADEWSLLGNDLEKSIFEHPSVTSEQDGWTSEQKLNFKSAVEAASRGDSATTVDMLEELPDGAVQLAESVYEELAKGVEAFPVSQYVLRRSITIASNSTLQPALDNVGKVYSTSGLSASEGVPATLKFSLPDGFWLKRTPSVEPSGVDKWVITQEYWHADEYSTFLYGEPVA